MSTPPVFKNLADARMNYAKGSLDENSIPADPLVLFDAWMTQHQQLCDENKNLYVEPNAMVLSTCNPITLRPSSRMYFNFS